MSSEPKSIPRKSLLEKYDIPIGHLDFDYIKSCNDSKEIEKMLLILKSGEEGYYPDLMKCARDKLTQLNPDSKVLREEQPVMRSSMLDNDQWQDISKNFSEWTSVVKEKDKMLRDQTVRSPSKSSNDTVPPIRQLSNAKISTKMVDSKDTTASERIKSCDYKKWDKYDADTETLKIDLNEEINREKAFIDNKKKMNKSKLIETIDSDDLLGHLTDIEKENLAEKHRIKGNDFFRSTDYQDAINEYTIGIQIFPTATLYNNRALTYLKMRQNSNAIKDCNECLRRDSKNIKAFLRKGQALLNEDNRRDAYQTFCSGYKIDPSNATIKKYIDDLRKQLPDLPPINATRIAIQEVDENEKPVTNSAKPTTAPEKVVSSDKNNKTKTAVNKSTNKKIDDINDDFAKLIIPNKIVKSKLSSVASTIQTLNKDVKKEFHKNLKNAADEKMKNTEIKFNLNAKQDSTNKITKYSNGVIIEEL